MESMHGSFTVHIHCPQTFWRALVCMHLKYFLQQVRLIFSFHFPQTVWSASSAGEDAQQLSWTAVCGALKHTSTFEFLLRYTEVRKHEHVYKKPRTKIFIPVLSFKGKKNNSKLETTQISTNSRTDRLWNAVFLYRNTTQQDWTCYWYMKYQCQKSMWSKRRQTQKTVCWFTLASHLAGRHFRYEFWPSGARLEWQWQWSSFHPKRGFLKDSMQSFSFWSQLEWNQNSSSNEMQKNLMYF